MLILFVFCSFAVAYTANDNIEANKQDVKCVLIQECRANICIYECIDDGISYNKYIMQYGSIEEAYAIWLELTGITYLLQVLPKEETNNIYEQTSIIYKWHNKQLLQIILYEKNILVGSLTIEKIDKQITIKDKINFLR